jgi:hypothetical protein
MEFKLLTSIIFRNEPIYLWPFIQVDNDNRLYYKVGEGENPGFDFYSVEWKSCWADHGEDIWNLVSVTVECGICGHAYWDGVRHLYWGHEDTDNYGYHYYPDLKQEIAVLSELRKLEEQYCNLE